MLYMTTLPCMLLVLLGKAWQSSSLSHSAEPMDPKKFDAAELQVVHMRRRPAVHMHGNTYACDGGDSCLQKGGYRPHHSEVQCHVSRLSDTRSQTCQSYQLLRLQVLCCILSCPMGSTPTGRTLRCHYLLLQFHRDWFCLLEGRLLCNLIGKQCQHCHGNIGTTPVTSLSLRQKKRCRRWVQQQSCCDA